MRIVYDARHFGPKATGVGRYNYRLLEELQKLDSRNEYFLFLQKKNFDLFTPWAKNFKKVLVDAPIYSVKEQVLVPITLYRLRPDLVHFPHFNFPILYFGRFVVTIHDLIPTEFGWSHNTTLPLPLYLIKHLGYKIAVDQAIRRARAILSPSNYVKEKIISLHKVSREKIFVTYEASGFWWPRTRQEAKAEDVLGRFGLQKPYFLYVGLVAPPHKNASRLLDAVRMAEIQLVIITPRLPILSARFEKMAGDKGVGRYIHLLHGVSDPDLVDLYRNAQALVFPSLSEGFGLPAVEAMSLGCPVLCSNVSSLPEVVGDAALLFDPYSPNDIAEKISRILKDKELRAGLVKKGLVQAKKYSWEKMAKQTLEVYKRAASE